MNPSSLEKFIQAAQALPIERKTSHSLDQNGEYQHAFPPEFPFEINRTRYPAHRQNQLLWHTYFEIFILLSDTCRRQMGDSVLTLHRGDLLLMDHLKLHRVMDFPGEFAEALVIRFLPDVVRSPGMMSDHTLLLPFQCHFENRPHLLRATDPVAAGCHETLVNVLENYAWPATSAYRQTGARAHFLVLLHQLARHFQAVEKLDALFVQHQARTGRLRRVFEHLNHNFAEANSLPAMATLAGLSPQRFNRVFKNAAGMTLREYLAHLRLTQAGRMLRETDRSIGEIAASLGFSDQSHFDRRFRRHYGRTPKQFRQGTARPVTVHAE